MLESTKDVINNIPGLDNYIKEHYFGINGINSPIDKKLIPYAQKSGIIFSSRVADRLYELSIKTQETDFEYSFVLIGNIVKTNDGTKGNGAYVTGFFEHNTNVESRKANYDEETIKIVDYITQGKSQYDVLFVCHTHPAKGNYYMNFSLGDLDGTVALYENNRQFKISDFGNGILTGDQQIFFVFYDPKQKRVYQFEKYLVNNVENGLIIDFKQYMQQKNIEMDNENFNRIFKI